MLCVLKDFSPLTTIYIYFARSRNRSAAMRPLGVMQAAPLPSFSCSAWALQTVLKETSDRLEGGGGCLHRLDLLFSRTLVGLY